MAICKTRAHAPLCQSWVNQDTACVVQEETSRIDDRGSSGSGELINRRKALLGLSVCTGTIAAISLVPVPSASAVAEIPEWLQALVRDRLGRSDFLDGRVELEMPNRADTGLSVPLTVSVPDSPMTESDYVKSLHVFSTRNPQPLISDYYFTPRSGVAKVSQRIRLAQTQYIYGFAIMSDESAWMSARHVTVTLGACAVEIFLPDEK